MRKKLLTVGLAVLMAISSTSCKSSEKTQTAKEDTYKNYKQYNTSFGLKYKIPNDWNKTDTSTSTDLTFSKDDDTITHGLIGVYYYEFDGDIIQKENFRSLVSNIKDGENYNGKFHSESSTINGVKVNFFSYELDINGDAYFMKGIVFNCGNGYCILDFIYPTNKDYGKLFDNIANSISVNTSAIVTATEKPNETEASVSATEEPTTTEVTTEATTEKTTQVKPKSKDITDKDIDFSSDYRNDSTGKWRIAITSDSFDIEKYALSYYLNYFKDDDEIHVIVNFTRMTTTKISDMGDTLDVSIHEYTKGEEHDANKALGGMLLNEYHVNIKTGKITKIQ